MKSDVERRLIAILVSDMAGYSRLMEIDELGTLARLKTHRLELIDPSIERHKGRFIKSTGDGFLAEFASVDAAAQCALAIQRRMLRRNFDVPPDRRILFRMGLNIGDVIVEDGDVFGDGVNIAARLEQLADIGGICVSEAVREQLARQPDLKLEDMGEQQVKSISRPIRAYRLVVDEVADSAAPQSQAPQRPPPLEPPSIAVLPFVNMSSDPEQDFFADGLTEDIITALSHFRELTVISRNTTFAFKGKSVKVQEFARTLNVRYVVEGSVRKAGNRVRVTAQVIDALSDRHVWAGRYDRELADIFDIQDDVTSSIVSTVFGRVEAAEQERVKRQTTENMAAYECVLAAKSLHHRSSRADNLRALELIARAVELDPDYAHAHAWKACIIGQAWTHGWAADMATAQASVMEELKIAQSLDENDSDVHRILAAVNVLNNNHDRAFYHQERALSLNPNDDLIVVQHGEVLTWLGRPEEGIDWIKRAMRLNPHHPERFWSHLGRACFVARRYGEAIEAFGRITTPDQFHNAFLAANHVMAGDPEKASVHARAVLSLNPGFSIEAYLATLHYKDKADLKHHREALSRVGLPP